MIFGHFLAPLDSLFLAPSPRSFFAGRGNDHVGAGSRDGTRPSFVPGYFRGIPTEGVTKLGATLWD